VTGPTASGFLLGLFAVLLGVALTAAALRRRRRRALYGETYASTGGIAYTVVQIGCAALFILAGLALMILAIIFRR
jgi:uncharacterized membrane protein HdeD (DUF308 family)